jgi:hypothetical protein
LTMPGLSIRLGLRSLATVKTAISLQTDVYRDGVSKANNLFSGNFSAYIGYLISRDREQRQEPPQKKDNRMLSAIEQILEI